jgi:hypothetical protein
MKHFTQTALVEAGAFARLQQIQSEMEELREYLARYPLENGAAPRARRTSQPKRASKRYRPTREEVAAIHERIRKEVHDGVSLRPVEIAQRMMQHGWRPRRGVAAVSLVAKYCKTDPRLDGMRHGSRNITYSLKD